MTSNLSTIRAGFRACAVALFMMAALSALVYPRLSSSASRAEPTQERRPQGARRRPAQTARRAPRVDYTNFSHRTKQHQKACSDCHKFPSKNWKEARKGQEAFPDVTEFPEHSSCLECHRDQFFARERPAPRICSNCHVQISPRNTARFPFPSLTGFIENPARGQDPVSDFAVGFPHDKHADVMGQNQLNPKTDLSERYVNASFGVESTHARQQGESKSCTVCHQTYMPQGKSDDEFMTMRPKGLAEDSFWLKKGTFKTTPLNHATCFTCHSEETGIAPAPSDCNACHKLKAAEQVTRADFDPKLASTMGVADRIMLSKWKRRDSSGAFRHEVHEDQSCAACHQTPTMNTLDAKTLKVRVQSCGGEGCHITQTADEGGILNFEVDQRKAKPDFQCTKCHVVFGKEAVPENHLKAISALNKK